MTRTGEQTQRDARAHSVRASWSHAAAPALVLAVSGFTASVAQANPAMSELLRRSEVSERAAQATTVSDQLAQRRFGAAPSDPPGLYRVYGYTFDPYCGDRHHRDRHRNRRDGHRDGDPLSPSGLLASGVLVSPDGSGGPLGPGGAQGGISGSGFPDGLDTSRLKDNFNPDHYADEKPWVGRDDTAWCPPHRRYDRRGYISTWSTGYRYRNAYYYDSWYRPYPYGVDGRLVQPGSNLTMPAPSQAVQPPPPEPEDPIDAARRLTHRGTYSEAVEQYRVHLADNPDDFDAMADLIVALAGDGRFDDAAAMARLAFSKDPTLASRPLDRRLGIESKDLRKIVVRAVRFAHDRDAASSWLLVAFLMQGEGRDDVALRMLSRATDRGLEVSIADAMRAELRS